MRRGLALLAVLAFVAGCSDGSAGAAADAREERSSEAAQELDLLARETGALPDESRIDPAGRYGRRYEGGRDSLCLVPDGSARGRYRFGAETRIGRDEYCRGTGRARLAGDKLLLDFAEGDGACRIVARYEGDKVVMPGGLDVSCAALCSSRGSFSGVSFPRLDRDVAAARRMTDQDKVILCR